MGGENVNKACLGSNRNIPEEKRSQLIDSWFVLNHFICVVTKTNFQKMKKIKNS